MKKITSILALLVITITSFAQKTKTFGSVGTSYTNVPSTFVDRQTYNLELGCQTDKTWYSLVCELPSTKNSNTNASKYLLGVKAQRLVRNLTSNSSVFGYTAVKAGRNTDSFNTKTTTLMVEPGMALNFNLNRNLALQGNLSTYFTNNFSLVGNWPLKFGVAIVYSK